MTIPTARLIIVAPAGELEAVLAKFAEGPVDVALAGVELSADGELLRHDLLPHSVIASSLFAVDADQLPDERIGPLLRVYATHPDQEA